MKKKKILYWSDSALALTGFGQVSLRLLKSWFLTGKYDIVHLCSGSPENDPNFSKFPWKCIGTIPNNPNIIQRMNQDPNYGRACSYGLEMIESIVLDFKPDVILAIQDPWGSSDIGRQKEFWNKTHCIAWETLDSTPIYQSVVDNMKSLHNYYCWSSFAERELHRLGHTHVKTMFPPVDTNNFRPLNKKQELKQKFNILDKKFILNYTFRSQLRKQSWGIIEGLSVLQKENPEIAKNVWLHFHTSLEEGWNHKKFCEQYNVDYNHLLWTWICQNCKNIEIKCDNGDKNCKSCGSKDSQKTPNVGFGLTPKELNEVYNVADCECVVANSGATEIPAVESLASGLPLATINYSYGEDFCKQPFVFTIEATKSVEFGTQFIKMMPVAQSIADFIKKLYNSSQEELDKISKDGREWVVNNFSTEVVSKKWQDIIDNLPEVTWNFKYDTELKPINSPVQDHPDDIQFIKNAYKSILNMEVKDDDSGLLHWIEFLKQPKDKSQLKNELVNTFRNAGNQHNQKVKPNSFEDLLDKNGKKQFLIVCPESAGDCLYVSATFKSFRESYPEKDWNLYLATKPEFMELFDGNHYLTKVLPYQPFMDSEIGCLGQGTNPRVFDGYCFITAQSQKFLNYLGNHNINLQLTQK